MTEKTDILYALYMFRSDIYMDVALCSLDGNADAVEFCPHNSFQHVFAASTYTPQEGDQPSRCGSISIFHVDAQPGQLKLNYRMETAGIFDIKWSLVGGNARPLLAQADADGYLKIHKLKCGLARTEPHSMLEF
jgi:diphthine methyl ester acylhydrolase